MMKVVLLGTGSPKPRPHRAGSSHLVRIDDDILVFDCGPGATVRAIQAGYDLTRIEYLFFTHHHFDHDLDYAHFVLARWDQGTERTDALQVFGPPPTERMTRLLFGEEGVFADDIRARTESPSSIPLFVERGGTPPRPRPRLVARDIGPGPVCTGRTWEVTAAPTLHAYGYHRTLAYRVDADQGSVVVSGDTAPCRAVARLAKGADVLLHMCHALDEKVAWNKGVSGPRGAGQVAQAAGVRTLVLVHIGEGLDAPGMEERAVAEARSVFDGEVVFGRDATEVWSRGA